MKYGLILLVACLPLAVLTADSFFAAVEVPRSPPEPDWRPAEEELLKAKERLAADTKVAKLFSEPTWSEEIQVDKLPPDVQKKATKSLANATRSLGRVQAARRLAARFQHIDWEPEPKPSLARWVDRAQRWLTHMEDWDCDLWKVLDPKAPEEPTPPEEIKARIVALLPESGDVFTRLAGRVAKIKAGVEVCVDVEKNAPQLFKEKKYKECLDLLEKVLNADPAEKIENAASKEIREVALKNGESLRERAAFLLAWHESPPPPLPGRPADAMDKQQVTQELDRIDAFFKRWREALRRNPDPTLNRNNYEQLVDRQKQLNKRLDVLANREKIIAEIKEMAKSRDLVELRKSAAVLEQKIENNEVGDKSELRESARESVRTWLETKAFPLKRPPDWLRKVKEAVDSVNRRRIGWWSKTENQINWRFSPWNDPKTVDLIGELPEGRSPGRPMYVQLADDYNSEDKGVGRMVRGASQEQWREFFDRCKKWQEDYETYQGRWRTHEEPDKSCKDWNFLPEKSVLPQKDLDDLCKQLAELQGVFAEKAAGK